MKNNPDDNWSTILTALAIGAVAMLIVSIGLPYIIKHEDKVVRRFTEDVYCQMNDELSIPCH